MSTLFFANALLPDGWARNVAIECDPAGTITGVTKDAEAGPARWAGEFAVPGMANLHSHAFQRAMAGLAEWRGAASDDSFWTWREVMYRFLERLTPDDVRAIASQLYVEMAEAGFTAVGEFHYLHHQPDGSPYSALAEMAGQIAAAADAAGIALTLLPVYYQYGGFGGRPVGGAQARFANDPERFLRLRDDCRALASGNPRNVVGAAPHSLRAVTPQSLEQIVSACADGPLHIHVAEQTKEVDDCQAALGARPVEWLLDNQNVDENWCLIHATHMTDTETRRFAASGAVAGLCPITEANLGDGIFNGVAFHEAGGRFGVGSDSNVRIDLAEELRSLEYSQRLRDRGRNRMVAEGMANGRALFDAALRGGVQALGQPMGQIAPGFQCDLVSLDAGHPVLTGKQDDNLLNGWIFSGDKSCVADVWIGGRHVVQGGRHIGRDPIRAGFASTMERLRD
jgi:formiminoglutamate deiminase